MSAPGSSAAPTTPKPAKRWCRLLVAAGRDEEAEQQRTLAIRRLGEAGVPATAAAPRDGRRSPSAAKPRAAARFKQEIHFCPASDGTTLAYSVTGDGPPLVKAANWLNHLEADLASPIWRHWIRALTAHPLASGATTSAATACRDWNAPLNFDAFVDDLESVVDAAGLDRFDLLGISQGAAVAIAYAVRHPERVRKMHLWGGYALGWAHRGDPAEIERREAMLELTRQGWALDNPAYRQLFTSLYLPEGTQEQEDYFNEMQRVTTSAENAVALQRVFGDIDVTRPARPRSPPRPSSATAPATRSSRSSPAGPSPPASPAPASSPSKAPTTCCWKPTPAGRSTRGSSKNSWDDARLQRLARVIPSVPHRFRHGSWTVQGGCGNETPSSALTPLKRGAPPWRTIK